MTTAFAVPPQLRISALKDNTNRALIDTDTQTDEGNQSITVTMRTNEAEGALMDTCDPITNYRITIAYPDNSTLSHTTGSPTETIPLNRSCVQCIVVAQAQTEHGYGPNSEPHPTTFGSITLNAVRTDNVITVDWNLPHTNVSKYEILALSSDSNDPPLINISPSDDVASMFANADPCKTYNVSLHHYGQDGTKRKITADKVLASQPGAPIAPRAISAIESNEKIRVTWEDDYPCPGNVYIVLIKGKANETRQSRTEKWAEYASNVVACEPIVFRVRSTNHIGKTAFVDSAAHWPSADLSKPKNLQVQTDGNRLHVKWDKEDSCDRVQYAVTVTAVVSKEQIYSDTWKTNDQTIEPINLEPCTQYQLSVKPTVQSDSKRTVDIDATSVLFKGE
ncbi:unnamed protein product [Echinostoma caproni]|uniref:Fibronectin type-III domain-containing protein n=1 Tax=Echinostoma caproni TaxID=27848 RepID=A0A183B7T8_9TREM|nr:unnamed protein product [Echinostoma caproni]